MWDQFYIVYAHVVKTYRDILLGFGLNVTFSIRAIDDASLGVMKGSKRCNNAAKAVETLGKCGCKLPSTSPAYLTEIFEASPFTYLIKDQKSYITIDYLGSSAAIAFERSQ